MTSSLGHNTELLHQRQIVLNVPIVSNEPACNPEKIGGDETDGLGAPQNGRGYHPYAKQMRQ
jgi:hypothetical protein